MKMKNIITAAFISAVAFTSVSANVSAATKEDVLNAVREASPSETFVQAAENYLQGYEFSPEDYDEMIEDIYKNKGSTDTTILEAIREKYKNRTSSEKEENAEGTSEEDIASMTDEELMDYIVNMPQSEKNQLIKDLDRDAQMEIIDNLIDTGSKFGMNVSVESLTKDKIEYSIRDEKGSLVDISAIGVIVDDTGIDYTAVYLMAAGVVFASVIGIGAMARSMKKGK